MCGTGDGHISLAELLRFAHTGPRAVLKGVMYHAGFTSSFGHGFDAENDGEEEGRAQTQLLGGDGGAAAPASPAAGSA